MLPLNMWARKDPNANEFSDFEKSEIRRNEAAFAPFSDFAKSENHTAAREIS